MMQPQYDKRSDATTPRPVGPSDGQIVVASYPTCVDAERAVDYLSDQRFPVQRTAMVGRGPPVRATGTGRDQSGCGRAPPISGCRHTSHATNATLTAVTATRMVSAVTAGAIGVSAIRTTEVTRRSVASSW